jgi:hypothetical protein
MEASELRIGSNYKLRKTTSIDENVITLSFQDIKVNGDNICNLIEPIPLTEEWLINFDFEDWGWVQVNEHEKYKRWVIHNILDGTSNFEVHEIHSTYGGKEESYFSFSVDNDERINVKDTETVHGLQNCFYLMSGFDLTL